VKAGEGVTRQEIDRGWLTGLPCGTRWKRGRAVCSLQRRRRAGVAPWAKPQLAAPSCYPRPNFEIRSLFCRARALSPPGPPSKLRGHLPFFFFFAAHNRASLSPQRPCTHPCPCLTFALRVQYRTKQTGAGCIIRRGLLVVLRLLQLLRPAAP
jgi:hypothetical protein